MDNVREDTLYVVIPAYNEQDNIEDVVNEWYEVLKLAGKDSRLVIVDDGSRDNTYDILQELAKSHPQLTAITKPNSGHGATILYAYNYAVQAGADFVFQTDSDGQTRPAEFTEFWQQRNEYDMLIGHRNKRQDGWSRIFVTKVLKLVVKICFGTTITDANTPFRLMKASVLREALPLVPKDFNLSNVILSVIFAKQQRRIRYMPITFRPRQGGVNSINFKRICGIGWHALHDFMVINKNLKAGLR